MLLPSWMASASVSICALVETRSKRTERFTACASCSVAARMATAITSSPSRPYIRATICNSSANRSNFVYKYTANTICWRCLTCHSSAPKDVDHGGRGPIMVTDSDQLGGRSRQFLHEIAECRQPTIMRHGDQHPQRDVVRADL